MKTSQILKFEDSPETQKSKYFESKMLFFLQTKIFIHYKLRAIIW